MPTRTERGNRLLVAALIAGVTVAIAAPAQAAGLFANFAGAWSGNGTIKSASGANERIRCKATYKVENDDNTLSQQLRCASDSYRFDVESKVTYDTNAAVLKGTWQETANGVGGFVTGSASGGQIKAHVKSKTFAADIDISTSGGKQSVSIRPKDLDITEVAVSLKKG